MVKTRMWVTRQCMAIESAW